MTNTIVYDGKEYDYTFRDVRDETKDKTLIAAIVDHHFFFTTSFDGDAKKVIVGGTCMKCNEEISELLETKNGLVRDLCDKCRAKIKTNKAKNI